MVIKVTFNIKLMYFFTDKKLLSINIFTLLINPPPLQTHSSHWVSSRLMTTRAHTRHPHCMGSLIKIVVGVGKESVANGYGLAKFECVVEFVKS